MSIIKKSTLAIIATLATGWFSTSALAAVKETHAPFATSKAISVDAPQWLARHGADDAAGDDRGGRGRGRGADDGKGHARRGADDAAGDDRGGRGRGRGADDGKGHARRGADDAPGDDRGGRGRGRGADDGKGHA